ncbi:hypothetical protein H0H92_011614, partial [Tricholoma furcatifolium]
MDFLRRSVGMSTVPEVYGYSPTSDNPAGTEYIFTQFIPGTRLDKLWYNLGEEEIISITRQLVQLESQLMSIPFPAGGNLYYTKDLENAPRSPSAPLGITLESDRRFCVGPDTDFYLWSGERSKLDVDRGPYKSAEAVLLGGADKELAYLQQFGRPLLPFVRIRRLVYGYQEQLPSDHIANLERYRLIAPSIVPEHPVFHHFCMRSGHFDPENIIVSRAPDSSLRIVGQIDWQYTSIRPLFLHNGIPTAIENFKDESSKNMQQPFLSENFNDLDEISQSTERELHRRRLVHYHYVQHVLTYNELLSVALSERVGALRRRLFDRSRHPWLGETIDLKLALIRATKKWEDLAGGETPCPILFDPADIEETMQLDAQREITDKVVEVCESATGVILGGCVPIERYEEALAKSKEIKDAFF